MQLLSRAIYLYTQLRHLCLELLHLIFRLVEHPHYLALMRASRHGLLLSDHGPLLSSCKLSVHLGELDTVSQLQLLQ